MRFVQRQRHHLCSEELHLCLLGSWVFSSHSHQHETAVLVTNTKQHEVASPQTQPLLMTLAAVKLPAGEAGVAERNRRGFA